MESRLILGRCSRNLFFRSKWAADLERLPQSQHVGRDEQSRLVGDKTERRAESAESRAACSGFSWTLTGAGRWWRLYLFIQQSEFAKSQLDCKKAYLHSACEYIHGIKVRQGLGRWGLLSRWWWPRGVMAPVRCRWLGASCSISPREKEAVMKRALACPGNRSSSLTVSGEDLQSSRSKTLRPARGEGCRRGVVAEAVGGALMREEQQLVSRWAEYGTGRNGQRAAVFGVTGRISRRRVFGESGGAEIRGVSRRLGRGSAG